MKNLLSPSVSIGVPVYNGEKFLFECLKSILEQTFQDWECIVCDNQSTDNSFEIAKEFEKKDKRFKVIKTDKFVPLGDNWNNAFLHSNRDAKYYRLVQADDLLFPESLEVNVRYMEQYPNAGMSSSYRVSGNYVDGGGLLVSDGFYFDGKEMLLKHLKQKVDISGSITQLFFRIESLKEIENYPCIFDKDDYHVDTRLFYEMLYTSDIIFTHRVLSYTRRHDCAETSTTVLRFNTFLHGKESRLFRFKSFFPELERDYNKVRRQYAYFLFKCYLKGNKKGIAWHKKWLQRKISLKEYFLGVLCENFISYKFKRLFK